MEKEETFGGEIAKQVPVKAVYDDVFHPTLTEIGKALQGVTRIALSPISALVWGYDKVASYLDVAVPEYFAQRRIPQEKIKTPDPSIAVPTVLAMTYNSHKPELRDMFTNLLGASMTADVIDGHPAFVEIIKQLCSDEAKMLREMKNEVKFPMIKVRIKVKNKGEFDVAPYFSDLCYRIGCEYPQKFPEYLDNLQRLGLVDVEKNRHLVDDQIYETLKKHPNYVTVNLADGQSIVEQKSLFEISELGKKFCAICIE